MNWWWMVCRLKRVGKREIIWYMMTSSDGDIFRVADQWIPRTKASDAELFFIVQKQHKTLIHTDTYIRGALMLTLICVWINDWVNNREAGDLRRYRTHYDVIVITWWYYTISCRAVYESIFVGCIDCFQWNMSFVLVFCLMSLFSLNFQVAMTIITVEWRWKIYTII